MKEFLDAFSHSSIPARIQALQSRRFSDVVDGAGHQYVDLVQEGGGVLGIALVGYTHVMEQSGIRFFSLAGTSAGAINTIMMASLGAIDAAKSEAILKILSEKNLFDLVDGDKSIKKLVQKYIRNEKGKFFYLVLNALKIYGIVKRKLGVNPGNNFSEWITAELAKAGVRTLADLMVLRTQLPAGLRHLGGSDLSTAEAKLAIITSDITTHTKVEFPRMANMYWWKPEDVPPAKLVRASMSIPFFFEPFTIENIPSDKAVEGQAGSTVYRQLWEKHANYTGPIPPNVKFVDGGMLSNFPINVFHRADGGVPTRPTFGVRLSTYRDDFVQVTNLMNFSGAMISTMRQIHDYDFLMRNPDFKHLICRVDADKDFNWLDFEMTRDDQVRLFMAGAAKALDFLECFEWETYKALRAKLKAVAT